MKRRDLTDKEVIELEALSAFLTRDQMASYFNFANGMFDKLCKRDERVMQAYRRGRAKAIVDVAGKLLTKAREGDNACMFFYLKTQAGWNERQIIDVGGQEDNPLEIIKRVIVDKNDS